MWYFLFFIILGKIESTPIMIKQVTVDSFSLGRDFNITEASVSYEYTGDAPLAWWPKYEGHPNFTTWIQTWLGANGVNYGKAIVQGRNINTSASIFDNQDFILQTDNGNFMARLSLLARSKLGENFHLRHLIGTVISFTKYPASEVISNTGDDIQIEWEFTLKLANNIPWKQWAMSLIKWTYMKRNGRIVDDTTILYEYPEYEKPSLDHNKYSINVSIIDEKGIQTVKLILFIQNVEKTDIGWYSLSIHHLIHYHTSTNLIVNPNESLVPKGKPVVLLKNCFYWRQLDQSVPVGMAQGEKDCLRCMAIGEGITSVSMIKDGQLLKHNGNKLAYTNTKVLGITDYWYMIPEASEADLGKYTCVVEKEGYEVQFDFEVPGFERVKTHLQYNSWDNEDLILTCEATGNPLPTVDVWMRDDYHNTDFDSKTSLHNDVNTRITTLKTNNTNAVKIQIDIHQPKEQLKNKAIFCWGINEYSDNVDGFLTAYH